MLEKLAAKDVIDLIIRHKEIEDLESGSIRGGGKCNQVLEQNLMFQGCLDELFA